MFGQFLDDQISFCVTGARGCAACQKRAKNDGFAAVSTTSTATLHYTALQLQLQPQLQLHYITLLYTILTTTTPTLH